MFDQTVSVERAAAFCLQLRENCVRVTGKPSKHGDLSQFKNHKHTRRLLASCLLRRTQNTGPPAVSRQGLLTEGAYRARLSCECCIDLGAGDVMVVVPVTLATREAVARVVRAAAKACRRCHSCIVAAAKASCRCHNCSVAAAKACCRCHNCSVAAAKACRRCHSCSVAAAKACRCCHNCSVLLRRLVVAVTLAMLLR